MDALLWELLAEGSPDDIVPVLIRLSDIDKLPFSNVRVVAQIGNIASCRIRRGDILVVRNQEEVFSMKAERKLFLDPPLDEHYNYIPNDSDQELEFFHRPELPFTGKGVCIGIADWGFDFTHPNFLHPDGTTRFQWIWDQGAPYDGSNCYGYGAIHSADDINRALLSENPFQDLNYYAGKTDIYHIGMHGTHVLDIAAGNGNIGIKGMAPDANLIAVHLATGEQDYLINLGTSIKVFDALHFMHTKAKDCPLVINMSVGSHADAHAGLSLIEQSIDQLVATSDNRAVIQSCGNYYASRVHTEGRLATGDQTSIAWLISKQDKTPNEMEVWYEPDDEIDVSLQSPDGAYLMQNASEGRRKIQTPNGEEIGRYYHRRDEPNTKLNTISIILDENAEPGNWMVTLTGKKIIKGRFHSWIERDQGNLVNQSRFPLHQSSPSTTTGSICNGFHTISVGAYDPRDKKNKIAFFSSEGPTWDGRPKPDLTAPGVGIPAAKSASPFQGRSRGELTYKTGTSMAAPCVAGAAALIYESVKRPINIQELRKRLLDACVLPDGMDETEKKRYGAGILHPEKLFLHERDIDRSFFKSQNNFTMEQFEQENESSESLPDISSNLFPALRNGNLKDIFASLSAGNTTTISDAQKGDILIRRQYGHHEPAWMAMVESVESDKINLVTPKGQKITRSKDSLKSPAGEVKILKSSDQQKTQVPEPGPLIALTNHHSKAERTTETGEVPGLEPLSLLFAEDLGSATNPAWIEEDVEQLDPGIQEKAMEYNRQFWNLYNLERIQPITGISALKTPRLFANRVREGQLLFTGLHKVGKGVQIVADGIFGYRTLVLLAAIAGEKGYEPSLQLRYKLSSLGFNMESFLGNDAKPAIKRAWTVLAPLQFKDVWSVNINAIKVLHLFSYTAENTSWGEEFFSRESLRNFLDYILFAGKPPAWLANDDNMQIRIDLLAKSFKNDDSIEAKAALVTARRGFLHNYWDQNVFFAEKIKNYPSRHVRMWRVLNRRSRDVKEILEEKNINKKDLTTVTKENGKETTGVLVQYFIPVKAIDVLQTIMKFQSEISSIVNRLSELLDWDQYRYIKANRITEFLTGLPINTTFGELFYGAVDKQLADDQKQIGGIERLVSKVEKLASINVFILLIQLASGGKYEKHPAMERLGKSLEKLRESTGTHEYITSGARGVVLQKKKFIGIGDVTTGGFRLSKSEVSLKKERAAAVVKRVEELFKQLIEEARKAGDKPYRLQDKNPDEIIKELIDQAVKELNITEKDNVEMNYEEGFRILDVQETEKLNVKHIQIKYERVFRLEEGKEFHSSDPAKQKELDQKGWQPMEGHAKDKEAFRSQSEFEEDLGWVYFSNYMKATQKIVTVIAVVGTVPVVVMYAGPGLVIGSITFSVGFYVGKVLLTDEEFSAEGFLNAVIEGYVGALGMRFFMPAGGFLAKLLSKQGGGFTRKLGQYMLKTAVGGGGTGAFTLVGSQFLEDILMHDRISDASVYIAKAKAGFCFGFLIEFGGTPIMKKIGLVLEPALVKTKDSMKDIWLVLNKKLDKKDLTDLPKKMFETAQEVKVKIDIIMSDPQLASAMMNKTQAVLKDFLLAVKQAPGKYIKEFEIVVYENAMFLAEKKLLIGAQNGFEKLLKSARATGMKAGEINNMVNLLKDLPDDRLVNAWLHMVNETDNAILNTILNNEIKNLALNVNILKLRSLIGRESVTSVFLFHFRGSTKEFGEFAGRLLAMEEQKARLIIDLLFNKGNAVSPGVLMNMVQRNSSLDPIVAFGLGRLGKGARGQNLDVGELIRSVPDSKLDSFLRSVSALSEKELNQLIKLYARKDKALLDYLTHVSGDLNKLRSLLASPAKAVKGPVPPPLPKSLASSKSFQPTGKPLQGSGLQPGKLRQLPKRTIFVAPQATSESEAIKMFFNAYKDDPLREVAIYQNTDTKEFIIVQGERGSVSMAPGDPGFAKSVKEVLNHDFGNWQLRGHSHPVEKATKEVLPANRYPSGSDGDFGVLIYESAMANKSARSSSIFYLTKDGIEQTIFTYNPKSLFKRYEIDIPAANGKRITKSFMSLRGYRKWFKKQFGIDLDPVKVSTPKVKSAVTVTPPSPEQVEIINKIFAQPGVFKNSELTRLYEKYKTAKTATLKPGEKVLTPDEWVLATRGEARKILDKELPEGWIDHLRKAKEYSSRMQGEISIEVTEALLRRFKDYPADNFGDPPFEIGDRITLGPSIERINTDAMRKDFLDELRKGNLYHLDPYVMADFENAIRRPQVGTNVIDIGPRPGGGRYYWPIDDIGSPWQLHHIWPLEWNGPDILINMMPMRYRDHQVLHEWWTDLKKWALDDWEARLAKKLDIQVERK